MKRVLFTIISLLIYISSTFAQSEMFEWQTYSAFDEPKQVIEGKEYIYFLADGYLFSYDNKSPPNLPPHMSEHPYWTATKQVALALYQIPALPG